MSLTCAQLKLLVIAVLLSLGYVIAMQNVGDLVNKLFAQYQFFNYIITGGVFMFALSSVNIYTLKTSTFFMELLVYYAVGFFMSRLGAATLERLLKKLGYIKYEPYEKYLRAVKKEPVLDDLSQQNNIFKTAMTTSFIFAIIVIFNSCNTPNNYYLVWSSALVVSYVFMYSYQKQSYYISTRVKEALSSRKTRS